MAGTDGAARLPHREWGMTCQASELTRRMAVDLMRVSSALCRMH
ncbi:putative leader peptide [Streptacidiphilus sp. N1-10]|uniref:Leader peptide n=1 Tax=Streptacidiphilus jeojiensis TaxID=3229225 RepID=A0ABV6XWK8_9ACTN